MSRKERRRCGLDRDRDRDRIGYGMNLKARPEQPALFFLEDLESGFCFVQSRVVPLTRRIASALLWTCRILLVDMAVVLCSGWVLPVPQGLGCSLLHFPWAVFSIYPRVVFSVSVTTQVLAVGDASGAGNSLRYEGGAASSAIMIRG